MKDIPPRTVRALGPVLARTARPHKAAVSRAALAAAGAAALLLSACTARFESFPFVTSDGKHIEIRESPGRSREKEALFEPSAGHPSSSLFMLRSPVHATSEKLAFALAYTSTLEHAKLTIFSDRKQIVRSAILPATGGARIRFLVPVAAGDRIWGYQLTDASENGEGRSLALKAAGTAPYIHGFSVSADMLTVDGSVSVLEAASNGASAQIGAAALQEMGRGTWSIRLGLAPISEPPEEAARDGSITFTGPEGKSATFDIDLGAGVTTLDFARGSIPFLPRDVRVRAPVRSFDISLLAPNVPIPADPGMILSWDRSAWRRPDFELYSWDRFPHVLIFDTASYDVQDGLFKRLAYFVEKAGYRDTISDWSALEGKHSYNAHDYRAEDLARFFSTITQRGLALTPEEQQLQEILVSNDVIRPSSSGFSPGEGAVISISRSSAPILRQLLLTHESAHGVFFSLPAFRESTEAVWGALSPVEKEVWLDFLSERNYDTTDHYLVVNEFQAYLFQQGRASVDGFQNLILARLRARGGAAASLASRLMAERPHSFLDSFDALDARLRQAGGPPGSHVLAVLEAR